MRRVGSRVEHILRLINEFTGRFTRHHGFLRASALSFDTAIGLVPLLALLFIGLRAAGIHHLVAPFLVQQLAGDSQELTTRVLTYIQAVKLTSLGTVGVFGVGIAVLSILENLRGSFNHIWEVQEERGLLHRGVDYLIFLAVAPLLLVMALVLTSLFQSQWMVQWLLQRIPYALGTSFIIKAVPLVCSIMVMTCTYLVIPSVRVRIKSAFWGGVLAGTLWQAAHWGYFHFQFGVARFNAIYGAFSVLPFLLVWIYVSWLVVLAGFELVRWFQEGRPGQTEDTDWRRRDRLYF